MPELYDQQWLKARHCDLSVTVSFFLSTRLYCHLLSWKSLPCRIVTLQRRRDWSYWDLSLFCISVGKNLSIFSPSNLLFKIRPDAVLSTKSSHPDTRRTAVFSVEKSFKPQLRAMKTISKHKQVRFLQTQYRSWDLTVSPALGRPLKGE